MDFLVNIPQAGGISSKPLLYTAFNPFAWTKEWLKLLSEMEDYASKGVGVGLVRLHDLWQVWINSAAC
ncbi:MAG: hypothetical protein AAFY76_20540 [Cyanobacteria bacterium J06649_11]